MYMKRISCRPAPYSLRKCIGLKSGLPIRTLCMWQIAFAADRERNGKK